MKPKSLEQQIALRISESNQEVFLRRDFADLGSYDQVGRALRLLIEQNILLRIGYGLYSKAEPSLISDNFVPRRSIREIATEALTRLNIPTGPSSYDLAYNSGRTTQVPTGRVIAVKGRVSRKIGYDGKYVTFEYVN